jgi:hypothetical protein
MSTPNPERHKLVKVVERDRRCRNCGHGQAIPQDLTHLICACFPPTPVLLRAEVLGPGKINLQTSNARPLVQGAETCGQHEFPEEITARRAKMTLKMRSTTEIVDGGLQALSDEQVVGDEKPPPPEELPHIRYDG